MELARRYEIEAYPTILMARPDGSEMGRLVGFKEPEDLLSAASGLLAGIHPIDRLRERLEREGWENPTLRDDYAGLLARGGKHVEALEHYLWCFDRGGQVDPSYAGVRLSFLLNARLARTAR